MVKEGGRICISINYPSRVGITMYSQTPQRAQNTKIQKQDGKDSGTHTQ